MSSAQAESDTSGLCSVGELLRHYPGNLLVGFGAVAVAATMWRLAWMPCLTPFQFPLKRVITLQRHNRCDYPPKTSLAPEPCGKNGLFAKRKSTGCSLSLRLARNSFRFAPPFWTLGALMSDLGAADALWVGNCCQLVGLAVTPLAGFLADRALAFHRNPFSIEIRVQSLCFVAISPLPKDYFGVAWVQLVGALYCALVSFPAYIWLSFDNSRLAAYLGLGVIFGVAQAVSWPSQALAIAKSVCSHASKEVQEFYVMLMQSMSKYIIVRDSICLTASLVHIQHLWRCQTANR